MQWQQALQQVSQPSRRAVHRSPDNQLHLERLVRAHCQMMERNPDFAQLLNNPQLLRESLQVAANPVRAHAAQPSGPTLGHVVS